jgi:hypothetical protein
LDLKAFFTVVAKDPAAIAAAGVFEFLADQRGEQRRAAGRPRIRAVGTDDWP